MQNEPSPGQQVDIRDIIGNAGAIMFPVGAEFIMPPCPNAHMHIQMQRDETVTDVPFGMAIVFKDGSGNSMVVLFRDLTKCQEFTRALQFNLSNYMAKGYE